MKMVYIEKTIDIDKSLNSEGGGCTYILSRPYIVDVLKFFENCALVSMGKKNILRVEYGDLYNTIDVEEAMMTAKALYKTDN